MICDQDQTAADAGYTYKHTNGTQKQKWETFTDLADAKNRKKEVEYKESVGTFVAPQCRTLKDLLTEYLQLSAVFLERLLQNPSLIGSQRPDEIVGLLNRLRNGIGVAGDNRQFSFFTNHFDGHVFGKNRIPPTSFLSA